MDAKVKESLTMLVKELLAKDEIDLQTAAAIEKASHLMIDLFKKQSMECATLAMAKSGKMIM